MSSQHFIDKCQENFIGRELILSELKKFCLSSDESNYLTIQASAGHGVSSLLAKLTRDLSKEDVIVWSHFVEVNQTSRDIVFLLKQLCCDLNKKLTSKVSYGSDFCRLSYIFVDIIEKVAKDSSIVIILDAVDQLLPLYKARELHWLPSQLPKNVKVIVTSSKQGKLLPPDFVSEKLTLPLLNETERYQIVHTKLQKNYQNLDARDIGILLEKKDSSNPLYLKLALIECFSEGSSQVLKIIQEMPEQLTDLVFFVLERLEQEFGETAKEILPPLAILQQKITSETLREIVDPDKNLIWDKIYRRLSPYVEDGKMLHPYLKKIIKSKYFTDKTKRHAAHHRVAEFLQEQGFDTHATLDELPYHLLYGENWQELLHTLTNLHFLENKCQKRDVESLLQDFELVLYGEEVCLPTDISVKALNTYGRINWEIIQLLQSALKQKRTFLQKHPKSLFQVFFNHCYWYDAPETEKHYQVPEEEQKQMPWRQDTYKIYPLVEGWREHKEKSCDFAWLKSKRPLKGELDFSPLQIFSGHSSPVTTTIFTPRGDKIVSGSEDSTIRIWETSTGKTLAILEEHKRLITDLTFSPNGEKIASSSGDKTVKMWNGQDGKFLYSIVGHKGRITCVAFHPREDKIISGSTDQTLLVWNLERYHRPAQELTGHNDDISCVAYSPKGDKIASASWDQTIRIWDSATGQIIYIFSDLESIPRSISFSPDGEKITAGLDDNSVKLWDIKGTRLLKTFTGHKEWVSSVCFSPDGTRVISGSGDKTICVWNINTGSLLYILNWPGGGINSVDISADGKRIVSGAGDSSIQIWDAKNEEVWFPLYGHSGQINSLATNLVKDKIASGATDKTINIWNIKNGERLHTCLGHEDEITSLDFSPREEKLVSGSLDKTICIWDFENSQPIKKLTKHQDIVTCVRFNPQGDHIVSGSKDKTIRIWDVQSGELLHVLFGHEDSITKIEFSSDEQKIISHSADGVIRSWDEQSGTLLENFGEEDVQEKSKQKYQITTENTTTTITNVENETIAVFPISLQNAFFIENTIIGHTKDDIYILELCFGKNIQKPKQESQKQESQKQESQKQESQKQEQLPKENQPKQVMSKVEPVEEIEETADEQEVAQEFKAPKYLLEPGNKETKDGEEGKPWWKKLWKDK